MLKFWLTEQQSAGQILRVLEEKAAAVREGRQSEAPYVVFSLALQPLVSLAHNNGLDVQLLRIFTWYPGSYVCRACRGHKGYC